MSKPFFIDEVLVDEIEWKIIEAKQVLKTNS